VHPYLCGLSSAAVHLPPSGPASATTSCVPAASVRRPRARLCGPASTSSRVARVAHASRWGARPSRLHVEVRPPRGVSGVEGMAGGNLVEAGAPWPDDRASAPATPTASVRWPRERSARHASATARTPHLRRRSCIRTCAVSAQRPCTCPSAPAFAPVRTASTPHLCDRVDGPAASRLRSCTCPSGPASATASCVPAASIRRPHARPCGHGSR